MHAHSLYSFDADYTLSDMLEGARRAGVRALCLTDHVDFDAPGKEEQLPDLVARLNESRRVAVPEIQLLLGAEVSLQDETCVRLARAYIKGLAPDCLIGSVHMINGEEVWRDSFYKGRIKEQAYIEYLTAIKNMLPTFPEMDVLGHYDFVAKYAPYGNRAVTYDMAPAIFDDIFIYLLDMHKTLEINTSVWGQNKPWGFDVLKRFVDLGGKHVTIGSDAHNPWAVGNRFWEAMWLAKEAGVHSIAVFKDRVPRFLRL